MLEAALFVGSREIALKPKDQKSVQILVFASACHAVCLQDNQLALNSALKGVRRGERECYDLFFSTILSKDQDILRH